MKTENNHITDQRLSRYLDNEVQVSEHGTMENHLSECEYCRERLRKFRQLREVSRRRQASTMQRDLWPSISSQIDLLGQETRSYSRYKKWIAAAAMVLIVLLGGWAFMGDQFQASRQQVQSSTAVNQYAFDYGLYLSGLTSPKFMQRFNAGYNRQPADSIISQSGQLMTKLPQGFSVISTYLLESACCTCTQFKLQHNGQEITVFKQPKKHPAEFTGFHKKHAKIDSSDCSKVEAGDHLALTFDSGDSKYVVVGNRQDPMVTTVMHRLNTNH